MKEIKNIEFTKKNGLGQTIVLDITSYGDHIEIQLENESIEYVDVIPWTILNLDEIHKLKTWLNDNF